MQYGTKTANISKTRSQCLIVGVHEDNKLSDSATLIDKASGGFIKKVLRRGDIAGKVGQALMLHDVSGITSPRVLLVGLGTAEKLTGPRFRTAITASFQSLRQTSSTNVLICLAEVPVVGMGIGERARTIVETIEHTGYRFVEMKGIPPENKDRLESVDLLTANKAATDAVEAGIKVGEAVAFGVKVSRDLGNTPGNVCHPTYLAEQAKKLAKESAAITTKILEEKDMEKLGMGALLSVSQGSAQPAKLIIMQYKGAKASVKPHVLVGKGITFDTGGISLKQAPTMGEMIWDMCGAASVMGTMNALAQLNLPINVVGVVAAAENMPSGTASRPGDIVKSMSGQTIEINNTDAEGRLVLCDALTYIDKFKPQTVVDVATLTRRLCGGPWISCRGPLCQ